ncbi:MAG: hybrid sensor histidine kinase/response regulator [Desulfuromonadaceae bacterium]|nr:hybrid sensor histidine kinase/response regulator [Desulfuromonadaceae bacterium]
MPELLNSAAEEVMPHILVVDDEADIRQMVMLCLQKCHFRITCAENAAEANKVLVVEDIDAIISDVMMPGEDGIAFLARVHESWPELPVVLMTGHAQLQMAVNAIKNGAFDFVYKPFDFEHLRKIVQKAVNYHHLQKMEKNYLVELEETVVSRTAELRKSMAELDFARTSLQQALADKSKFMSTISHEMRTPMNGVIGSLDLLSEEEISGNAAEYLSMARQSAATMMDLIDQLLSFNSRAVSDSTGSCHDLICLTTLLKGVVTEQQKLFARKGINFSLKLAEDLPNQIWTDREKLSRLLEILIGNALKFTSHGSVLLEVLRHSVKGEEDVLEFILTDSGIGVPDGMLERIFEPFVQADSSFSRSYEGVGLGLAIARQNAMLLNGKVWAEQNPEGGSRFIIKLKISTP